MTKRGHPLHYFLRSQAQEVFKNKGRAMLVKCPRAVCAVATHFRRAFLTAKGAVRRTSSRHTWRGIAECRPLLIIHERQFMKN